MTMPPEPKMPCPHAPTASVQITGITDANDNVEGYQAAVRVWCSIESCGEPFVWIGVEPGLSPAHPASDITGQVLNAPLKPEHSAEGFGEGLPGYMVRARLGQPTLQDRTEMLMRAQGAIANPSLVTPRMSFESAESWAARAVLIVLELKD